MLPLQFRAALSVLPADQAAAWAASGLHPMVVEALRRRGVESVEEALGQYALLPFNGPHGLKGMPEMANALADAIQGQEKIVIVADYDCDGATACAIGVSGLRAMGALIEFVVPDRLKHGYGLTPSVVEMVKPRKPAWILTVDNGIAAIDGVEAALAAGIKVLVTDHHLPSESGGLPRAEAIVNPNQVGCPFPSKNLAGCGVMYYVLAGVRAVLRARGHLPDGGPNLAEWLDLVALGTVADVVKLDRNNRWLVRKGLERIRAGLARPGLQALFDVSKAQTFNARAQDFGFNVGPRINAAGRLADMSIGIQCLLASSYDEGYALAQDLDRLNVERKNREQAMKSIAQEQIDDEKFAGQTGRVSRVVFDPSFHEGVVGIVAGRIKEKDHLPTIAFAMAHQDVAQADGPLLLKGSGRSIEGIHLRDVLDRVHKRHDGLLIKFGGHAMAAGLTIERARLEEFRRAFDASVQEDITPETLKKVITVDRTLAAHDITLDLAVALEQVPWGQSFPDPLWEGVFRVLDAKLIGAEKKHLKMEVESGGQTFIALHFFNDQPPVGTHVRLVYHLSVNRFNNQETVQLLVEDREDVAA